MDGKDIDAKIEKRIQKRQKGANEFRNPFGNQAEANPQSNDNKNNAEDFDDYEIGIQGNVVNFDITNPKDQKQVNINDAGWEDKEAIVYQEVKEEKKKGIQWGDSIKVNKRAEISEAENFFPELGDETTQQKKEKKAAGAKNTGLFASGGLGSGGGNWGGQSSGFTNTNNRFGGGDTALRFKSKGEPKINKFMQQPGAGPVYDETLGDEETNANVEPDQVEGGDAPIKFQGKVKIGTDKTDADVQRERYLAECRARAEQEDQEKALAKEQQSEAPRFTNSKGTKNAGLFRTEDDNKPEEWYNPHVATNGGKRTFTNSNNVNKPKKDVIMGPTLDPNVPIVDNKAGIQVQVTTKGWD